MGHRAREGESAHGKSADRGGAGWSGKGPEDPGET